MSDKAIKWTTEDDKQSLAQGWGLFTVYGSMYIDDGTVQIQKYDEVETFSCDQDAVAFVQSQAEKGNTIAVHALAFLSYVGRGLYE